MLHIRIKETLCFKGFIKGARALRNVVMCTVIFSLSACSGGISGVMSSSGMNHWQIYRINFQPEMGKKFDQPIEYVLEDLFFNLGFKKKHDWGKPFLAYARAATFQQKYIDRYISLDVQISEKQIIIMSTAYSSYTKNIFDGIEQELKGAFGEKNIESCYGTKDLNGHSCFEKKWG